MKQIVARDGDPHVFDLYRYGALLYLPAPYAEPSRRWDAVCHFFFRLRKNA